MQYQDPDAVGRGEDPADHEGRAQGEFRARGRAGGQVEGAGRKSTAAPIPATRAIFHYV